MNRRLFSSKPIISSGLNFRPLVTVEGRSPGQYNVFRSGDPAAISEQDALFLKEQHQVKYYFDLRTPEEVAKGGNLENLQKSRIDWKMFSIGGFGQEFRQKKHPVARDYANYYMEILHKGAESIEKFLRFTADTECIPFIFGCYAGKDRTGVLAYILLKITGVSMAKIIEDYLASTTMLHHQLNFFESKWIQKGLSRELYRKRMTAKKETLLLFNRMLKKEYGDIFRYLKKIGISSQQLTSIANKLIRGAGTPKKTGIEPG